MQIEFNAIGLSLSGQVKINKPIPARRTGNPDTWDEGEPGEIIIESLECGGKDAMFLLSSDLGPMIDEAAYRAALR